MTITHSLKLKLTSEKKLAIGGINTTNIKITNEVNIAKYKYLFLECFLVIIDKLVEC